MTRCVIKHVELLDISDKNQKKIVDTIDKETVVCQLCKFLVRLLPMTSSIEKQNCTVQSKIEMNTAIPHFHSTATF